MRCGTIELVNSMKVQTGTAKGKRLKTLRGRKVRPTSSRIKKSIFDKLRDLKGLYVLDIFAGTGSLGIEALSRGASHATFVEKDKRIASIIKDNLHYCGVANKAQIIVADYSSAIKLINKNPFKFDLIFIDPPYELYKNIHPADILERLLPSFAPSWQAVVEHPEKTSFPKGPYFIETRKYGSTLISYFGDKTE